MLCGQWVKELKKARKSEISSAYFIFVIAKKVDLLAVKKGLKTLKNYNLCAIIFLEKSLSEM